MLLADSQIREAVESEKLTITDFDPNCLQPATYDLRIGRYVYAPPNPDQPIDLSHDGGAYRLPPYGTAVLTTHENLKLPPNMAGRIGLKSGLARLGVLASTGPQIDPGFEGKLFVSIFNVTAVPHVLTYRDTFLTIEFHTLDVVPDHPYNGPYQGKYTIGPEVLDALVRLEGLTLSEMQSQFTELTQHVKAWSAMATRLDEFLTAMDGHTKAINDLVTKINGGELHATGSFVEARSIPLEEAKKEILGLFRGRRRLFYSDLSEALRLDISTIIQACKELQRDGLIEEEPNGKTGAKRSRRTSLPRKRRRPTG